MIHRDITKPKKISIITASTVNRKELYDITNVSKVRYAEKNGYTFTHYIIPDNYQRKPHWAKIDAIKSVINDSDWVWWIDDDAIITNLNIDIKWIADDNYDFILCEETPLEFGYRRNSGSMLLKNSEATHKFLNWMASSETYEAHKNDLCFEQDAIAKYIDTVPELKTKILPINVMNSPCGNQWKAYENNFGWREGDLVFHVYGGGYVNTVNNYLHVFKERTDKL